MADQFGKLNWRNWADKVKVKESAVQGNEFARNAFEPLQRFVEAASGPLAKMAREYTHVALEGLSYSPANPGAHCSSRAMTQLYAPAFKDVLAECTSLLKERGDLALHERVDGTWDDPLTCDRDHYVLLGDRAKLEAGALLDPRTAIHQQGRTMTLCDLSHDMDSGVPLDQLKVTRTRGNGMQYIIDVNVVAFGTITVSHVGTNPDIVPAPVAPTFVETGTAKTNKTKKKKKMAVKKPSRAFTAPSPSQLPSGVDESAIVLKYPFVKPVLLRLVSNVIAPEEYRRYAGAHGLSWKVGDVDYVVTAQVWERGRKLAALME